MTEKLAAMEARYNELTAMLADPAVLADRAKWQSLAVEHSEYEPVMELYGRCKKVREDLAGCMEIIKSGEDKELVEIA